MQLSRIDLNLFTIFDAIYRDGGITPASKRLHLSQPAVSHALARLRELLDDPLFERRGHDMVPTPLARSIAANVAISLGGLEQLLQRSGRFDPATSPRTFTHCDARVQRAAVPAPADRTRCSAKPRTSTSPSCASSGATWKKICRAARSTSRSMSACRYRMTSGASA